MSNLSQFSPFAGGGGKLRYQEFTGSGTFTPSATLVANGGAVSLLLIGGGQGGGSGSPSIGGYGGNGGQVLYTMATAVSATTVTIGAGGSAGTNSFSGTTIGNSGGNTSFGSIVAQGGQYFIESGFSSSMYSTTASGVLSRPKGVQANVTNFFGSLGIDGYGGPGGAGGQGVGGTGNTGGFQPSGIFGRTIFCQYLGGDLSNRVYGDPGYNGGGPGGMGAPGQATNGGPGGANTGGGGGGGGGSSVNANGAGAAGGSGFVRVWWSE